MYTRKTTYNVLNKKMIRGSEIESDHYFLLKFRNLKKRKNTSKNCGERIHIKELIKKEKKNKI